MKNMFDKCQLGDLKLKSRIIRTGIWETQTVDGGFLTQDVFNRYKNIAKTNVGAIISEMFVLDSRDRFYNFSTHTNYKGFIKDYRELTDLVHSFNVPILGQLSFFFYNDGLNQKVEPNDISIEGIRMLQSEVIMFAKKLSFAGFDGIQLNLGNNFYLSRFINPYFNSRKDKYGGNTFNRMRIVLEIIKILKENYNLHINCKINPNDVRKGGITQDESIEMCRLLEKYGVDSIQITARTISYAKGKIGSHPFIEYANRLIDTVSIPVILGGTLRDYNTIDNILKSTNVEFISMSKPFTAQNDFLDDWKKEGKGSSICQSCNNCYSKKTSTCFKYD